jgi:ketosteroid isomerase-like protein
MQYFSSSSLVSVRPRFQRIFPACQRFLRLCPTFFTLAVLLQAPLPRAVAQQAQTKPDTAEPHERKHEERHEIELVTEQWRKAILKADIPALDALLDDDFMAITASGTLKTKEQTLEAVRNGTMHMASLDLFDKRIRFYGKTALVNGRVVASGSNNEGDLTGNYRYTQVFVRNAKGTWKIVSFEINRIREPKEHHEHEPEPIGR